jgi:hypothetical protein
LPPGLDLPSLIDDDEAPVRILACKLAGVAYSGQETVDLDVLRRVQHHMRDPDPGVQRAAMTAAELLTRQRYVAWDEITAEEYELISRLRRLWDGVRESSQVDAPAPEGR